MIEYKFGVFKMYERMTVCGWTLGFVGLTGVSVH